MQRFINVSTFSYKKFTQILNNKLSEKAKNGIFIQNYIKLWNDTKKTSEKFDLINNANFQSSFINIPINLISLNDLQKDRFLEKESKEIQLFHTKIRHEIFDELIKIIREKENIFLTGPRGVGKSHLLALFTIFLRVKKQKDYRILYYK